MVLTVKVAVTLALATMTLLVVYSVALLRAKKQLLMLLTDLVAVAAGVLM